MPVLNAKLMNEKLKRGWTPDDFARHLDMSENEFLDSLQKLFGPKTYNGWLSELRTNQKRKEKLEKIKTKKVEKKAAPLTDPETELETEAKPETELETKLLEELKSTEENIRKAICEKELAHIELKAKRNELNASLQKQKEALLLLKDEIQKRQEEVNKIFNKLQETASEMSKKSTEISNSQQQLEKIQEKIRSLQKVEIFVYMNGEIEVDNYDMEILDSSWNDLFKDLATNDLLENLTIKQIKQISKLIVLTKSLQRQNLKFEISFELEEVKSIFEQVKQLY